MRIFSLDTRGLRFFRVTLALVIIHDLFLRIPYLKIFYSDSGVLPRNAIINSLHPSSFSLYLISGNEYFIAFLYFIHIFIALGLLIGYKSKLMSFLNWLFLLSLNQRNPLVTGGGDLLLNIICFWSIFLPLSGTKEKTIRNAASFAYTLQAIFIYFFTVALKSGDTWKDLTAIYYALNINNLTTPLAKYFLSNLSLLKFSTWMTLKFELYFPLLLLLPFAQSRIICVFSFIIFHNIVLGLLMNVGIFPYATFCLWIPFLPSSFWNKFDYLCSKNFEKVHDFKILYLLPFYALLWNIQVLKLKQDIFIMPSSITKLGHFLGLEQNWTMFAPNPYTNDGHPQIIGYNWKGEKKIFYRKQEKRLFYMYPDRRMAKYWRNLSMKQFGHLRKPYAEFLCKEYKLERVEMTYFLEETQKPLLPPKKEVLKLGTYYCKS